MNTSRKHPNNDEPDLGADESVPLDGKDPVGEKMMEELGREKAKRAEKDDAADPGPLPEQFPLS